MTVDPYEAIAARLGAQLVGSRPLEGGVSAEVMVLDLRYLRDTVDGDARPRRVVVRQTGEHAWKNQGSEGPAPEYRLLVALAGAGLPVPVPRWFDDSRTLLPRPFVVLDWIEGDNSGPGPERAAPAMAGALARFHQLDPTTLDLPPLPAVSEVATQAADLLSQLRGTDLRFPDPPPRDDPPVLVHGDYWPGNVLWQHGQLVGLIDWEDAGLGDPEADLAGARLEFTLAFGSAAAATFEARYRAAVTRPVDDWRLDLWSVCASAGCLLSVAEWGLPPERETRVREVAEAMLHTTLARLDAAGRGPKPAPR